MRDFETEFCCKSAEYYLPEEEVARGRYSENALRVWCRVLQRMSLEGVVCFESEGPLLRPPITYRLLLVSDKAAEEQRELYCKLYHGRISEPAGATL